MKKIILLCLIISSSVMLCAAGFRLGMAGAVKQKVKELDKKVRENSAGPSAPTSGNSQTMTITGSVSKGAVDGAAVKFFALNADGSKGKLLGTASTDADGSFTASITLSTGQILAEATGGKFVNEVSKATETLSGSDILTAVLPAGTTRSAITPLTHMAASRARPMAASGVALETAVEAANRGVAQQYNQPDILGIFPVDAENAVRITTSTREQRAYGLVLAGLAQEAATLNVRPMDLAAALATDMDDGTLDGLGASPIQVPTITGPVITLPANAGVANLQTAINTFIASGNNVTNLTGLSISNTPVNINPTGGTFYIAATCLPAWTEGQSGTASLTARGGTAPYVWTVTTGSSLPSWLALSNNGILTGTAPLLSAGSTMSISPSFSVTCTDSKGLSQAINLTVTIIKAPPVLVPIAGVTLTVGVFADVPVAAATGGVQPLYFVSGSFAYGAPPLGMIVDVNGNLRGTPSRAGVYTFRVVVVDLIGAEGSGNVTVTVNEPPVMPPVTSSGVYSGTWAGTFHYTAEWYPPPDYVKHTASESFTLSINMTTTFSMLGMEMLTITSAMCSDPRFEATVPVTPDQNLSTVSLQSAFGSTSAQGEGFYVKFPNGSTIFNSNDAGNFTISADGRTLSSPPAFSTDAFSASTGVGDSNAETSGPGSYAYNWCTFTSWTLVKQ